MTPSKEEIQDLAARAKAWAESPEGQAALAEALEQSNRAIKALDAARKLDPEELHRPYTI